MPVIPHGERAQAGQQSGGREPEQRALVPGKRSAAPRIAGVIDWFQRGSMTRLLVIVSALFVAIFLLIGQTVVAQRQARQGVMLQDEAMLSLNALTEIMLDAETGQRGFLLTGNGAYLQPYELAKARLDPEVGALQRMGERSSDEEQQHIARAQHLIRAKIAEMDRTIELARARMMPSAIALVQTNTGQRDMSALRGELTWLRSDQAAQRQAAFDRVQTLENRLLPLVALLGIGMVTLVVAALRGERHRAWAQAEARQFAMLREANAQTQLLARELNHRVKNLFSVVLSIITISARKQAPTAEVLADIRSRVHALSLAHSSSQGTGIAETCQLTDIITNIMRPYGEGFPDRVRLSGAAVELPARMITPMGLLIHELATNGSKYGALSVESGVVEVSWQVLTVPDGARHLELNWIESGGPALTPERVALAQHTDAQPQGGFGSRLTALAAQQMGGTLQRSWPETGAMVRLICPLP